MGLLVLMICFDYRMYHISILSEAAVLRDTATLEKLGGKPCRAMQSRTNRPWTGWPFEAVEFFCGDSAVTKSCRRAYIVTVGLDIQNAENRRPYREQNPFDLSTAAGFASLGGWYSTFFNIKIDS